MEILYHYCSTQTFHSIIEGEALHLSSLSLSNDTMEGRLVSDIFFRLAEQDFLPQSDLRNLQELLQLIEKIFDGLGFCLSEDGDLLSQWRGYAADGTGVSIGFSRSYLEWLGNETKTENIAGFNVAKVIYNSEDHRAEIEPTYLQAKNLLSAGSLDFPGRKGLLDTRTDEEIEIDKAEFMKRHRQLFFTVLPILFKLYLLKSDAFQEEKEWRLMSLLGQQIDDFCARKAKGDRIIPYRSYKLLQKQRQPIIEIILGPKHVTPIATVENFLKINGFNNAQVRKSRASYR